MVLCSRLTLTVLCCTCLASEVAFAEVHTLTLPQALELASRQNPDVLLSRFDEQRAQDDIRIAKNPFRPKLYGGSGLAYTYGYPNTIEGNAPSLFQLKTNMELFNRPDSYKLAATKELARGSESGAQAKAEDVAFRTADLFLTASQTEHESITLNNEIPSLKKVVDTVSASVQEGVELPLEAKRATVNLALSQERLDSAKLDSDYYEMMLAIVLGFPATDRVTPVESENLQIPTPESENEAADAALRNNRELKQMQSNVLAKQLDLRSYRSERLPQVDLVAQYAIFSKQNFQQYFGSKFQRNNAQLGASITLPLLVGSASKGMADQAAIDMEKLKIQMSQIRNRIISDTRRSYQQFEKAKKISELARLQLDFARETLTVLLAQNNEGRTPLREVEQARLEESDKWIALYEAETQVTRTKLSILREMGALLAFVRSTDPANPVPAAVQP